MDKFDDQLSYLCYSTQLNNEQMLSPYQDTTRLMREIEMQGIPVTMTNLAIHRQKEEEMRQERMKYDHILQEAAAEKAREANKSKVREVVPDSDEDMDDLVSGESEECGDHDMCAPFTESENEAWSRSLGYKIIDEWRPRSVGHSMSFIDKFRYNAKRASLVQSRIKALERMGHVNEIINDPDYKFEFPTPNDRPCPPIISFSDASFGYPGGPIHLRILILGLILTAILQDYHYNGGAH
ncbi:hypothetical protein PIB30_059784 [Stylosanthes scabra]|uniref:ABC-transporter extension domain-containing protein n=1 Tax=Stylosanthes scabra TaxID=79078 RepID=A0ABU6TKX8_9FABA|nr:hypothetical protein [Stylosanthes scabra]